MDKLHFAGSDMETHRCTDANCAASNDDLKQTGCQENSDAEKRVSGVSADDQSGKAPDESTVPTVDLEQLQDELAAQKAKAEENLNRLVRLQADFDNYRKRTLKEKEDFFKYAAASLCEALLPVLDNFQLALAAKEQDPSQVAEGVAMIFRQLQDVLQKEGLTTVAAVGEQFDPTRHEAVMQEITDEYADNTVTEELRRGYFLKDKLLRPAMVKVAKSEG